MSQKEKKTGEIHVSGRTVARLNGGQSFAECDNLLDTKGVFVVTPPIASALIAMLQVAALALCASGCSKRDLAPVAQPMRGPASGSAMPVLRDAAGPRESKSPGIYREALEVLRLVLGPKKTGSP